MNTYITRSLLAILVLLPGPAAARFPFEGPDPWEELEQESRKHHEKDQPGKDQAPSAGAEGAAAPVAQENEEAPDAPPATPSPPPDEPAPPPEETTEPRNSTDDAARLDEPIDLDDPDHARLSAALHAATNEARKAHGLDPVSPHPLLVRAADGHARRMAKVGFFGHRDPQAEDRRTPEARARSAGVANPKVAENIATQVGLKIPPDARVYDLPGRYAYSFEPEGPRVPRHTYRSFARAVVERWLDSPGHRRNLLSPEALQVGCAAVRDREEGLPRFVVVQLFQWFQPIERPERL